MKPVHVRYMLTCENTIENKDNSVDFIKVFESITFKELPAKKDFYLVFSLKYRMDPGDSTEITLRILDPNNKKVAKEFVFDVIYEENMDNNDFTVTLITIQLPNFPINLEGFYKFWIIHDERMISEQEVLFTKEGEE